MRAIDKHLLEVISLQGVEVSIDSIIDFEYPDMLDLITRNEDMLLDESIEIGLLFSPGLLGINRLGFVEENVDKSVSLWEGCFIETHYLVLFTLLNTNKKYCPKMEIQRMGGYKSGVYYIELDVLALFLTE